MNKVWASLLLTIMSISVTGQPAHAELKDWQFEVGEPAVDARARWNRLTEGTELARGKAVLFSPKPAYELTHDENDAFDLTDGKLSERLDDRIWFVKDAVGWHFSSGDESAGGVLMRLDLGSVQDVGQIAIRLLGGREQNVLSLPTSIEFLASVDGENFHSLQKMTKLMPAEKELSDFKTSFYVAEEGVAFMHSFASETKVRARYIAIRIMPEGDVHTDQISVLAAKPGAAVQPVTAFPSTRVFTSGFAVTPKLNGFVVTSNIVTPNWLLAYAYGDDNVSTNTFGLRLELPPGLRLLPQSQPKFTELESVGGRRRYLFEKISLTSGISEGKKPLYIQPVPGERVAKGAKVVFTGLLNGRDSQVVEVPVRMVEVPKVPDVMGQIFDLGMGWVWDAEHMNWPGILDNQRHLGFNMVTTFPMWWYVKDGKVPAAAQPYHDHIMEARRRGFKILQQDSPFHEMLKAVNAAKALGTFDEKEAAELYNQVDGKVGKHFSPLYRGKYFQDEVNRVATLASIVQPDHLHWDIEFWLESVREAEKDPRAVAAWKASGKTWEEFLTDQGADMLRRLSTAARAAVTTRKLTIGLYHSDPKNRIMDHLYDFNKIYPESLDIAQPSLYVQGRAGVVADRIRHNYNATKKRNIVPWLTGGTYGEFDPRLVEPMVLETILNGASGITWFYFPDSDPLDYVHYAKALAALGRYPNLMKAGKPVPLTGNNESLHYTAFASQNEALLLIGNYDRSRKTSVTVPVPLRNAKSAAIVNGRRVQLRNKQITLSVPPGEFRLVHVAAF